MSVLFERTRDTSLEVAANCAEAIHHLRRRSRRSDRAPESRACGESSDFLYDYASLTLGYVNELARLGSGYTLVPARILERLVGYGACPPADCEESHMPEKTKEIASGGKVTFEVNVRNTRSATATGRFLISGFRDASGKTVRDLTVTTTCRGKPCKSDFEAEIDCGVPLTLSIEVESGGKLEPQRRVTARLDMLVGEQHPCSMLLVLHTK